MTIPPKWAGVHFGVVHLLKCAIDKVKKNEQVITQLEFIPLEELQQKREQMETWSQLCLDHLPALLKQTERAG